MWYRLVYSLSLKHTHVEPLSSQITMYSIHFTEVTPKRRSPESSVTAELACSTSQPFRHVGGERTVDVASLINSIRALLPNYTKGLNEPWKK